MRRFVCSGVLLASMLSVPALLAQSPNPIPAHDKAVYPQVTQGNGQVGEALRLAAAQGKRVVLDFGTNQCASCQVTAGFFTDEHVHAQIAEHFLLVHVNVGPKAHQNTDLARRYGADVAKGLPAIVVLDPSGKTLGASNEFSNAPNMSANDLLTFLNKYRD